MGLKNGLYCLSVAFLSLVGCASAGDPEARLLARQQSATIESLNHEIIRLNQELDGTAGSRADLRAALPKIEKMFTSEIARGDVRVVQDPRGLVITVLDHAIFDPDGTQWTSEGEEILSKVASVLSSELPENQVILEGHTDDQPIEGADGVTNWEYAIGRATAVLHFFIDVKTLSPKRFGVSGYAEYRPVASNASVEGRDKNRRVEIVITPKRGSDAPVRF